MKAKSSRKSITRPSAMAGVQTGSPTGSTPNIFPPSGKPHFGVRRPFARWCAIPIYTGRIRFGEELSEPFDHLRIIDDELFDLCEQAIRKRAPHQLPEKVGNLRSTSDGILTGILFCGSCEERLCYNHNTTVRTLADGTKRAYERNVYRCYRKMNSRRTCQGAIDICRRTDRREGVGRRARLL